MPLPFGIRSLIRDYLPDGLLGVVDYFRQPHLRKGSRPLNGQLSKQEIVAELISNYGINQIIETGTFRGTTARYLAENFRLPIISIEINGRYFWFSRLALRDCRHVTLHKGSSPVVLERLSRDSKVTDCRTLFYLDAHWNEYLPLRDELQIILCRWKASIIMVDDFRVPEDPGYGYDSYSPENKIDIEHIWPVVERCQATIAFPTRPSLRDTSPRGTAIIFSCTLPLKKDLMTIRIWQANQSGGATKHSSTA